MGTNTRIDGSGRSISWKGISNLFTPSAQRGATATAACCISHPSMLHSAPQRISFFNHPICQWSDRTVSPPLHLFLLRKGDRQVSQRKLPAQMTEAMVPPRSQLARCSVMRTSGQLVISSGFNCSYVLSAFQCVSVSISTGSGRLGTAVRSVLLMDKTSAYASLS